MSSSPERREVVDLSWFPVVFLGDVVEMLDGKIVFKVKARHCFESTRLVLNGWRHPVY